jgi:hypothetical protein
LIAFAAPSKIFRPVAVSPVRLTMSTFGLPTRASPITLPGPVTTFTTPSGNPAFSMSFASSIVVSGVRLAGFRTAVFPAARAGPSFHTAIISG